MASTRTFWIFPLKGNRDPILRQIENPKKYVAEDEIVIPVEIMEHFKAKATDKPPYFSFAALRCHHQLGIANLVIKDMKELGKGIFAGKNGMWKADVVVYSGVYAFKNGYIGTPRSQQAYLGQPAEGIVVDSKNMVNKSRYIQHLPPSGFAEMNESIAEANLQPSQFHFSVKLNNTDYNIPTVSFVTTRDISPGEIIGYDYGQGYWKSMDIKPSLFRPDGSVINNDTEEAKPNLLCR